MLSDIPGSGAYAPGVYYTEAFAPDAPVPFRTGVPLFIGRVTAASEAEERTVFFASRWEDFDARVRGSLAEGYLGAAVRGFFENGGERCAVQTVPRSDDLAGALAAPLTGGVLDDLEEVDLVCVPDAMLAEAEAAYRIQQAALDHCARTSRMAILDSASPVGTGSEGGADALLARVREQRDRLPRARQGALYFPWIRVAESTADAVTAAARTRRQGLGTGGIAGSRQGAGRLVPPCGHVAGVYSRVDTTRGARKAPANEILEGVVDLELAVREDQHQELNELGINCLRSFTGRGIRVYGARTLSGQSDWRFVNVTRLFLTLSRWMTYRLSDLVFEPHTPGLWSRVRDRLNAYCLGLFEQGALQGAAPEQSFFVKCDAETNPPDSRDRGMIVAEIGLAAVAPAEFIVVRVTRRASGATFTPSTAL